MDQLNWNETINKLNGVGPVATDKFASIGVNTIRDLMFHFPFRYEDLQARPLESILDGEKVTLKGTVVTPAVVNYFGGRKSRLTFRMSLDEHNIISVSFFNQTYLAKNV